MKHSIVALLILAASSEGFSVGKPELSRRDALAASFGLTSSLLIQGGNPAAQAAGGMTDADKDRIRKGYSGIMYLLDNFEQETTVCRENGGECKRDADAVRKALGLRSTTDPLFQIEKVFAKAKDMNIDPDKLDAFFDATEDWNSAGSQNRVGWLADFEFETCPTLTLAYYSYHHHSYSNSPNV